MTNATICTSHMQIINAQYIIIITLFKDTGTQVIIPDTVQAELQKINQTKQ